MSTESRTLRLVAEAAQRASYSSTPVTMLSELLNDLADELEKEEDVEEEAIAQEVLASLWAKD